jgi:hypothetical protein
MSKTFIIIGIVFIIIGLASSIFGKLPGDIVFKKGNTTVYFPIVTSIVISVILSLIFFIIGRFR